MKAYSSLVALVSLSASVLSTTAQAVVIDRLEASVNNSLILLTDLSRFRKTLPLRAQLDPLFNGTPVASKGPSASDKEVTDFLITERMIAQAFPVSDGDVEQEINSIQSNNRIDRDSLKSVLKQQGFSFDEYFEMIRASAAKRNLIDRDIRTRVTVSDDDVKNYFYNHFAQKGGAPSAYRVKIITVSPKSYKTPSAARDVALRALKDIRAGERFEEVAKRMSDDPSASSGGDLGVLPDDQISPRIRDELRKLKVGQVSEVLGNQASGFFILKLQDVKSTETDRFDKIKEEIRNQLVAAEYQHQISLWIERQRQNAFVHRAGEPSVAGLKTGK